VSGPGEPLTLRGAEADAARDQTFAAQLVACCNAALRVLRIHNTMNEAVAKPMSSLQQALESLRERHPRIVLAFVEGVFYLDDSRIRVAAGQQPIADQLAEELRNRSIGGFTFEGTRPVHELVAFFRVLNAHRETDDVDGIRKAVREAGVTGISVSKVLRAVTEAQKTKSVTSHAADVFSAAIRHVAHLLYTKVGTSSVRSKRIVHELVDLAERDPLVLLGLAGLRGTGSDESEHAVAVAALSIALGWRIGLDRQHVADLGLAALHHDSGLHELGEARDVDRHPVAALKQLVDVRSPDERLLRQIIVGFEHHRDFGGGGRPAVPNAPAPHLFSQIVRLANDFDGLTRGRRARQPLDVPEALAQLKKASKTAYNPILLDLFVDMVGGVETEAPAAPEPAAPKYNELDMMLAEFVGKKEEAKKEVERAAEVAKAAAPKKSALGQMKLKKIARKKTK
jgi:HD-GYP domain-containing protein (c-di-GMP phosphodiesterase class II)